MVDPISGLGSSQPIQGPNSISSSSEGSSSNVSFEKILRESIRDVDKLQHDANTSLEDLSINKTESVAEVMTAVEKADIAFRTLMQVRNKLVEAYEELLRIRV